jgi:asparagine synthetase A
MYDARRSYYIDQHDKDWAKLEENRNRNPRIEKEIAKKVLQHR